MTTPHRRPQRAARVGAALSLAAITSLTALPASAYNQTQSCTDSGVFACKKGETPIGIRWPTRTITYRINDKGSADINPPNALNDTLRQAVRESFSPWNNAACSDLTMVEGATTSEEGIGFSCDIGEENNLNLIVWREDWSYNSNMIYALTSVTFNPKTGIIRDADIEFNNEAFTFTVTDDPNQVQVDIRNTLTHEVGHFLGLDHVDTLSATMYGMAPIGELQKRDLGQDDLAGICAIYPFGQNDDEEFADQKLCPPADDGCFSSCSHVKPSGPSPWLIGLLGLVGIGVGRRRRISRA